MLLTVLAVNTLIFLIELYSSRAHANYSQRLVKSQVVSDQTQTCKRDR